MNTVLKGKQWLVGDKCTYADLSFFMWNTKILDIVKDGPVPFDWEEFPEFKRWQDAMAERPSAKKALEMEPLETPQSDGTRD